MSLHQIIYTEKRSGLYGKEEYGILSSDRAFRCPQDKVPYISAYKPPVIEVAEAEQAKSCMPTAYSYRAIEEGKTYAYTRAAYLGRSSFGRDANVLCHTVTADKRDLTFRPAEYISSPSFFRSVDETAVNTPHGTEYLPAAQFDVGDRITINKVMKFLAQQGNAYIFKNLLMAVFAKRETNKRIIICDEVENVPFWIAAVNYALPIKMARNLSFVTYAYDPAEANADIVGVLPVHTAFTKNADDYPAYYVFDLLEGTYPEFDTDGTGQKKYLDFIEGAMLHDYRKAEQFFAFTEDFSDMDYPSSSLYGAYLYYTVTLEGITSVSEDEFVALSVFSNGHGGEGAAILLSQLILQKSEAILNFRPEYLMTLVSYISSHVKNASFAIANKFRSVAVDSVAVMLFARDMTSDRFDENYTELCRIAVSTGIDLPGELMSDERRRNLSIVANIKHQRWITEFLIKLVSEYIHGHKLGAEAMGVSSPVGAFIVDILTEAYKSERGAEAAEYMLTAFSDTVPYFCEAYECVESAEKTASVGDFAYGKFCSVSASKLVQKRTDLFDTLIKDERELLVYGSFTAMLSVCDGKDLVGFFAEHNKRYFDAYDHYKETYFENSAEHFYALVKAKKSEHVKQADELLFAVILESGYVIPSSDEITSGILSRITYKEPSKADVKMINSLTSYEKTVVRRELSGKLKTLDFGVFVSQIGNRKQYEDSKPVMDSMVASGAVDLTGVRENDDYLDWVLVPLAENSPVTDVEYVHSLFRFDTAHSVKFAETYAEIYIKRGKNNAEFSELCTFLRFVFTSLGMEELQTVADMVRRLNQKRTERLRFDAGEAFKSDYTLQEKFEAMMNMQPRKKSIFDIFKRK